MDIEVAKKLIKRHTAVHAAFVQKCETGERYYRNKPDILTRKSTEDGTDPLRNADNRIPFNFHGILVNQKAAYLFTKPPIFDIGSDESNKRLAKILGEEFPKVCKDLCVEASNKSVGWVHVWKDTKQSWDYASVPAEQIIPVWSKRLKKELLAVLRTYTEIDEETGDDYVIYEYWNSEECQAFRAKRSNQLNVDFDGLEAYAIFNTDPSGAELVDTYAHGVGRVPFIPFFNNNINTGDLENTKELIDTYCGVFSGFVNDLEDIQEVIYVLTNYGGQNLKEFLTELKKYKAIKIDSNGSDDKSGVETLSIQIPVEAREKLLEITRKCIFEQGMGIDPDPQNFGDSSGVALEFLYALLELKAGLLETEFRKSFAELVRALCELSGLSIKNDTVEQSWTRTKVKNATELANLAKTSSGVVSNETIVRNHPWVDNPIQELEKIKEEADSVIEYQETFPPHDEE